MPWAGGLINVHRCTLDFRVSHGDCTGRYLRNPFILCEVLIKMDGTIYVICFKGTNEILRAFYEQDDAEAYLSQLDNEHFLCIEEVEIE